MKKLEEIDPILIDQAVRRLLDQERSPDREVAIAIHLAKCRELEEWIQIMAAAPPPPAPTPFLALCAALYSAMSIGLEVGYELGGRR